MTVWITATLTPEQAAAEPFDFDEDDRLELDGGHVVTLGTGPDGRHAVHIHGPSYVIVGYQSKAT